MGWSVRRPALVSDSYVISRQTFKCADTGRADMASLNRDRVEHALNELLVRIVPEDVNEDEEQANERFEDAYNFAIHELSNAGPLPVADINHAAGLVDERRKTFLSR